MYAKLIIPYLIWTYLAKYVSRYANLKCCSSRTIYICVISGFPFLQMWAQKTSDMLENNWSLHSAGWWKTDHGSVIFTALFHCFVVLYHDYSIAHCITICVQPSTTYWTGIMLPVCCVVKLLVLRAELAVSDHSDDWWHNDSQICLFSITMYSKRCSVQPSGTKCMPCKMMLYSCRHMAICWWNVFVV